MKTSRAANDDPIDLARQVWQPRLGCDLSHEAARQIVENVTGFFILLASWSRAEMPLPANDTSKRMASAAEEACRER